MPLSLMLFLVLAGSVAGLVGSLLGLGGGILIIPVLVLILKIPMHTAIATSLLCVIATSSAAASRNVRSGLANVRLGITLETATVLGAIVGSAVAGLLSERVLMIIFACALLLMAYPMARGVDDETPPESDESDGVEEEPTAADTFLLSLSGRYSDPSLGREVEYQVRRFPVAIGISSVAGILSGLLGVGGGIIKVPVLTVLCRIPIKAAAATSNFMIGVTAFAGAVIYYGRGEVYPVISAASVLGVFAGSRAGTLLVGRIHANNLRRSFAIIMLVIATQLILKSYGITLP